VTHGLKKVMLVGGMGSFGRNIQRHLIASGVSTLSVDRDAQADVVCDVERDGQPLVDALAQVDVVLLCTPEAIAITTLSIIDTHITAQQLVVDICSVKSKICAFAQEHGVVGEYMSVHPMFGPEREFAGSNAVCIEIRSGEKSRRFRQLLTQWGIHVIETDAKTHDQVASLVQVFTHAVLCTFANARTQFDISPDLVAAFATPVFSDLEKVSQGLVAEDPLLYHNIQSSNPWAAQARDKLLDATRETVEILAAQNPDLMVELFERVRMPKT